MSLSESPTSGDVEIRALERAVAGGDQGAAARLVVARARTGDLRPVWEWVARELMRTTQTAFVGPREDGSYTLCNLVSPALPAAEDSLPEQLAPEATRVLDLYREAGRDGAQRRTPTMAIGSGCKVHLRADELPTGRLVVSVSKHLVAVVDGVVHDTHDPRRGGTRCVYGYWTFAS